MTEAAAEMAALESRAEARTTPCGDGQMMWRRWGRGRPVVLCHGGSGSWLHWIKTIPALEPYFEVWVPDLPGLGESAMPPVPQVPATSGRVLAEGLHSLLPAQARPHIVAFSFGAQVGTFAAVELGRRVAGLTIIGCAALGLPRTMLTYPRERSTMTAEERRAVHRRTLEILMFCDSARIDALAVDIQEANIKRARFRSRTFALTDEIKVNLARVPAPLSAIWGEKDVIAEPSVAACFEVLRLHHPELDAHVVADAGHWVMYEQADAFNATLLAVLERAAPR